MKKQGYNSRFKNLLALSSGVYLFARLLSVVLCATILSGGFSWGAPTAEEDSSDFLLSLPYVQYVETEASPNKKGTTIYKKDKAFPGYSIFVSHHNDAVDLIDMNGALIHKWKKSDPAENFQWHQVTPFSDGSIFLTSSTTAIDWERVDINSHAVAIYNIPEHMGHHSAYCLKDGSFLGIVSSVNDVSFKDLTFPIKTDSLVHVSPAGEALKTIPLNKLFTNDQNYQRILQAAYKKRKKGQIKSFRKIRNSPLFDVFHANNIENLEWDIPGIAKKGDWLVTIRNLNRIFIIDPEKERIVWEWGENIISRPHHATFLKGNQILLFDNGVLKKSSRVIILDIRTKKIVWQYGQKPGQEFFSRVRGSAQKLPNGNILIAESDKGRIFEVTSSGEIVWEWYADFYTQGPFKGKRRAVYRMERIPYDFFKNVRFNHGRM